ncbi:exo-beta-N-acetylmuramidase NamZ family protein [Xanthovirga aplysinae]|uniref:exo-beta-N-acetylmuramidase NamZ family protein n=1 Tax=Xanthovirga aplysinae TaxID=2529853 RepID=UPI0012BC6726|nr:DUF1343 domain-containing protein [Xanthovirga aplysinae]MTI32034.1 DUF1343 domain-containing protein [Xanthovirga aplysinae]
MVNQLIWLLSFFTLFSFLPVFAQGQSPLTVGAEQFEQYLPQVQDKKLALVVNQTSRVGEKHLVDALLEKELAIVKIFSPEHGFRGDADAGEQVANGTDPTTGLPLVSLYGKNKKPTAEQLQDVDVVIFDIQDVGVRFYTYISTLHYVMEACAENGKTLIVLDRPNPNGDYVDGPVLRSNYRSFVGLDPLPIVHGVTVGELAEMINGEKWLKGGLTCELFVVPVKNYTHSTSYSLPVKPSPNLPNDQSIRLYPSLCLFEGTRVSIGRGTTFPFQVIGYPDKRFGDFSFTPKSIEGMAKYPKLENEVCYGVDLRKKKPKKFNLSYLIDFYLKSDSKEDFFNAFFDKLAGNSELKEQIKAGFDEKEIRVSWVEDLLKYKAIRKKYLLYPDFE